MEIVTKFDDVKKVTTEEYFQNNQFSIDAFKKKYALTSDESYSQAVKRVCDFVASVEPTQELREYWSAQWFDEIYNDWWHPSGGIMQGAGSGRKISLANCFSKDTEFITDQGLRTFEWFNDGQTISVMNNYGAFVPATVKNFGPQRLYKLTLGRYTLKKEVFCTANHIWRTVERGGTIIEKTTMALSQFDQLPYVKRKWMPSTGGSRYYCPIGFIHGYVFGDGDYDKATNTCRLHLCGDSKELVKLFNGFNWSIIEREEAITVQYLPSHFKSEIPELDKYNEEYVLGFLIGYFAADGSVDDEGRAYLACAHDDVLLRIKKIIESVGIYCSDIRLMRDKSPFDGNPNHKLYGMHIWKDCLFDSFFTKTNHKQNWETHKNSLEKDKSKVNWKVVSLEETDRIEDVWCVQVPEFHNFTLSGGLNTGNCTTVSLGAKREDEEWDSLEAIIKNAAYTIAKCAAYRQGLGVDFCLAPGTLILTADLKHVPVEKLNVGDKLIGFGEELNFIKSTFKECVVESVKTIRRPSYRVITDKGEMTASSEHLWVARDNKKKPDGRTMCNYEWRTTDKLKIGDELAFTTTPWKEIDSWEGGYLSGILDGEGWLSDHQIGISQNKGLVFDKIVSILDKYKIDYYVSPNNSGCQCIRPKGKWENVKLVGMFCSPRLFKKSDSLWKGRKMGGRSNPPAKILSIEFIGEIEVIATATSTKTLIANGFLTHNSRLRPNGCKVLNSANQSTGAVHWMEFEDKIGYFVGQNGRIPAMLFSISCDHPDVEEFIRVKSDYTKIQNANISVQCTEKFYKAVENDEDWEMSFTVPAIKKGDKIYVDVHSIDMHTTKEKDTGRYYRLATHDRKKEVFTKLTKARKLMELIAKNMHQNAEPGIQNIDIARKYSNSDALYDEKDEYDSCILSTNACCLSIDAHILTDDGWKNMGEIYELVKAGKKFLVMSYNIAENKYELKELLHSWQQRNDVTITLTIEDGNKKYEIECSSDHPILTKNRGYVRADSLTSDDDIVIHK